MIAFLKRAGIDSSQVSLRGLEVTDAQANPYSQGPVRSRFIVTMTLVVRSSDVEGLRRAGQAVGELVAAGAAAEPERAARLQHGTMPRMLRQQRPLARQLADVEDREIVIIISLSEVVLKRNF